MQKLLLFFSCGGNVLINVGPTKEGRIPVIFEERLRQLGSWLNVNGEAIYETQPWRYQNDTTNSDVWYTSKGKTVYGIVLKYPSNGKIQISAPQTSQSTEISLVGYDGKVQWLVVPGQGTVVDLSNIDLTAAGLKWAFVLKFANIVGL
jgi:alpha-L-fucosidase